MNQPQAQPRAVRGRLAAAADALGLSAAVAAGVVLVLLAVRLVCANDTGYHLACGEDFLTRGRIVQTSRFIYTKLDPTGLAQADSLAPGGRFDGQTHTYHFVNGQWLGQVVMALTYRLGGMVGLGLLAAGLAGGIAVALTAGMRQTGVPWHGLAAGLLLVAAVSYERLDLRPELLGYLMLALQLVLLAGPELTWRRAGGAVALQVLAVNVSGCFIFGLLLPAAMLLDESARCLWARTVAMTDASPPAGRLKRLTVVTGALVLACLVNPWFFRGAVLPLQTAAYVGQNRILQWPPPPGAVHPWSLTGDWTGAFDDSFEKLLASKAFVALLALACAAAAVAALRRRWGWLALLAVVSVLSAQARRGLGLGAILLTPLALAALAEGWRWVAQPSRLCPQAGRLCYQSTANSSATAPGAGIGLLARVLPAASMAVAVLCLFAAALSVHAVVSQRLYVGEGRSWRFGLGASQTLLPLDAAEWININKPSGAVFCDLGDSSNLLFLTSRQMPVTTGLLAQPPYVMRQVLELTGGLRPFEPAARDYGLEVVVLRSAQTVPPLAKALAASPDWVIVQLSSRHVVFLRRNGANAFLARANTLVEEQFAADLDGFLERVGRSDPVPESALHHCAQLLDYLGWTATAVAAWRQARGFAPDHPDVLFGLGTRLAVMGNRRMQLARALADMTPPALSEAAKARAAALEEWLEARDALAALVKLQPDYPKAQEVLIMLDRQLDSTKPSATRSGQALP